MRTGLVCTVLFTNKSCERVCIKRYGAGEWAKMVEAGKIATIFGWKTGTQLGDPWSCDIFLYTFPTKFCAVYTVKCILVT